MKELIEKISERLLNNEKNQTFPILLLSAKEDRGQMNNPENILITKFPAALINIKKIGYESTANFVQKGDATIVIRLFDKNENSFIWDVMENTNKRLHGRHFLSSEFYSYGVLNRTNVRKIKREDAYTELELHYSIQFMDTSCMRMLHMEQSPDPKIRVKTMDFKKTTEEEEEEEKNRREKKHHSWRSTTSE